MRFSAQATFAKRITLAGGGPQNFIASLDQIKEPFVRLPVKC